MKNKSKLVEVIGWYGMAAILLAYALNSFKIIDSSHLAYQLLNLTGAIGVVVVSYVKGVMQPAVLNMVWAIIAVIAIIQISLN